MLDAILAHERGEEKNCTGDNKGQRLIRSPRHSLDTRLIPMLYEPFCFGGDIGHVRDY